MERITVTAVYIIGLIKKKKSQLIRFKGNYIGQYIMHVKNSRLVSVLYTLISVSGVVI